MVLSPAYRWAIVALVFVVVSFLFLNPLQKSQFGSPSSDESYYCQYASLVVHKGEKAFHGLVSWYASSDEARMHPAPVRVGYILLSALLFKLFGVESFSILGWVSTISFILFLYVCFYYARKHFDLDTALLTVLFLASSPLMLGLSRRALVDSPVNLLWGLAVWLFLDVLSKPNRFSYTCFLMTLFIAITFKETSLILIPFFVMAGIIGRRKGAAIKTFQIWGIIICPLIFIFLFYGWIYGGAGALKVAVMALAKTHFSSHYPNPYAIYYCSGPWFRYLLDFLLLTPIVTLLFIGYVGYLYVHRMALDFKKMYFMLYFVYVYGILSSLAHSKVVRFVVNLEMVMGLFAVLMLAEVFKGLDEQKRQRWLVYAAVGIFLYNWSSFVDLFYRQPLLDPISCHLLMLRHFIPKIVSMPNAVVLTT